MSEQKYRESPLHHMVLCDAPAGEDASVLLAELPFQGLINLRGRPDDASFTTAVVGALGCELPLEPNTVAASGERMVFWLGPDEWLIVTLPDRQDALKDELCGALVDCFCSVVDVTGYYTIIAVGGRHARDLLAKGCTLDMHPQAFGTGQCAQTQIAKASVLVWPVEDASSYRLLVRRSFADYFGRWLREAVREFGAAADFDFAEVVPVEIKRVAY